MISAINFVEFQNRVVAATYCNLMIKAKVVLVDQTSDAELPDPVVSITSPLPTGTLRISCRKRSGPGSTISGR